MVPWAGGWSTTATSGRPSRSLSSASTPGEATARTPPGGAVYRSSTPIGGRAMAVTATETAAVALWSVPSVTR